MRIKIYYFLSFFILFIAVPIAFLYQGTNNVVNAACVNNCARWVVEACKDQRGNSCSGGHANCDGNSTGVRYCRICKEPCDSNPPRCERRTLDCNNTCGQPNRCISDGCGGQSCCAATAPCPPVCTRVCPTGQHCTIATCPAGAQCLIAAGTQLCVPNPTVTSPPNPCPKRPQGDANCDQSINDGDFAVIRLKMRGGTYTAANHSADFNNNGKVDLVDYEIWRNTVKQ
ncbi:MAG: dockerin type I domain-containing protein [Microgenomates group bacterium]